MSEHAGGFFSPRVLIPFTVVTLIWGSTWLVIRDQLSIVPPTWSVTYRFTIASIVMFGYAALSGASLRIGRTGHWLALAFGIPQFMLNYNFVYAAEQYVTSGLVAVMFALLLVPNTALSWLFLKEKVSGRFLAGSLVAMIGVALLFVQEMRHSTATQAAVLTGIGLTILAILTASFANVMQATKALRERPIITMLAWAMFYGVIGDAIYAYVTDGPPVIEHRLGYWVGLIYLGVFASALAFTAYFSVIRSVGAGKAAYSGLLVPIIAMALSTAFEGYHWSALAVAGGMLALAGLFIALRASKREAAPDGAA